MREKVIISPVLITKKGEIKSFQIKLPSDVKTIIGIESTVKGIDFIYLNEQDVVRHRLVREIIEAYNR